MFWDLSFQPFCFFKNSLRWPDTIYLREGQLFWNQIFSCSTAFDCWNILDAEKGMLEVYQKHFFIEIDTNIRKFSAIFLNMVFKENAYYRENEKTFFLHITLNRCWNLKDFRDQVSDKSAPHNLYNKRWLIWIKGWIKFILLFKLFRKVDSQGEDVTNRPVQNSKTVCVILICFFNKMVFRAFGQAARKWPEFAALFESEKCTVRIRQNLVRSFVILFYGCSRRFYEVRQKEQKI